MAQKRAAHREVNPATDQPAKPDPALKRLDKLVGTWELTGRTLDSKDDNISGRTTIEWMHGGHFLLQRVVIEILVNKFHSLEIVGYDPATNIFQSTVYSSMDGVPAQYHWDVQGNV